MSPTLISLLISLIGEALKVAPEIIHDIEGIVASFRSANPAPTAPFAPGVTADMQPDLVKLETPIKK